MAKAAIDIDRLARQAMSEAGTMSRDEDDEALIRELDGQVCGWGIVIKPLAPRTKSDGGILLAQPTVDAQTYAITVGKVVGIGPTALEGKTSSGIELAHLARDIRKPEDLLRKFVMHQKFTGVEAKRRDTGSKLLVLEITNLVMIVPDPDKWVFMV